jgi:hypothetical protein
MRLGLAPACCPWFHHCPQGFPLRTMAVGLCSPLKRSVIPTVRGRAPNPSSTLARLQLFNAHLLYAPPSVPFVVLLPLAWTTRQLKAGSGFAHRLPAVHSVGIGCSASLRGPRRAPGLPPQTPSGQVPRWRYAHHFYGHSRSLYRPYTACNNPLRGDSFELAFLHYSDSF